MTDTHTSDDAPDQDAPETIALAREMGWKPEDEWKGDPPKGGFSSATEFVRRGEKILPIVNARARKAEAEAAELRNEIRAMRDEHRDTIKRIEKMSSVALEHQKQQIVAQYEARKEAAVEVGDKDAYRKASSDEREALKAIDDRMEETGDDKGKEKEPAKELPKAVKETIDEWITVNSWFNADEEMQAVANARHMKLLRDRPGLPLKENLEEVAAYVKKRFPDKFGDDEEEEETPRRRGSPVEGGSRLNGAGGGGTRFSKMPADARAMCDKFIKEDGLFLQKGETAEKDLSKARERYAKQYFGDDE